VYVNGKQVKLNFEKGYNCESEAVCYTLHGSVYGVLKKFFNHLAN